MKKQFIISFLFFFTAFIITNIYGQTDEVDLNAKLGTDPNVKIGTLANGLKYYIRENKKPENRVEMRLVIKAGSLQESDEQQGLAHFAEHMCFNGTKNFEKNELIDFLERMGIRFGSGLNAYTSFEQTVYKLQLPTDNEKLLNTGYQVLEDWAHNVTFDPDEIDKERGVIIEEWRLGLNANDRMRKEYLPVILQGSRYAERLPIGKIDVIENFKPETLIQFYEDWYRPELMAVIVVGDINPTEVEKKIKEHFSKLTNPVSPKKRVEYTLPKNAEPIVAIATDEEATSNNVMVFYKHEHKIPKTLGDFRELLKHQLYNGMINKRLKEFGSLRNAPFVNSYIYYGDFFGRSSDAYIARATAKENQIKETLQSILVENERIKRHGFNESEFRREIVELMRRYESAYKEKDKTESRKFIREYIDNFIAEDPIPGIENEMSYLMKVIRGIKLEEINDLADKWITDENMVVLVTAPEKERVNVPDKDTILQTIADVKNKEIEPYLDKVDDTPLLKQKPEGTEIVSRTNLDLTDYSEVVFKNGVRVVLKPTQLKNDEILLYAYSPGGHSLSYAEENFFSAYYSADIIENGGVGGYPKVLLDKKLSGKVVEVKPYINELTEGFSGKCSPNDLETMLQLVYLYFVQPTRNVTAFDVWKEKIENRYKHMISNPVMLFYDTLYKVITQNDPRTFIIPSQSDLDRIDIESAYSFYNDRFDDASDFTFFLVGNFDENKTIELLKSYLGGLPSTERKETWANVQPYFPEGITEVIFEKGMEEKSMVALAMAANYEWDKKTNLAIDMLMKVLSTKLLETMREEQSGVYGVRAFADKEHYPETKCKVMVSFGCDPDNVEDLINTVLEEMIKIKVDGPEKEDYMKAVEIFKREREAKLETNRFWLNELRSSYFNNEKPEFNLQAYKELVESITMEDIKFVANMLFNTNSYVKVVLMPDKKAAKRKKKK